MEEIFMLCFTHMVRILAIGVCALGSLLAFAALLWWIMSKLATYFKLYHAMIDFFYFRGKYKRWVKLGKPESRNENVG